MRNYGTKQLDKYDDALTAAFAPADQVDDYEPADSGYDPQTQEPDPGGDYQDSWDQEQEQSNDIQQQDQIDTAAEAFDSGGDIEQQEQPELEFYDISGDQIDDQKQQQDTMSQFQRDGEVLAKAINSVRSDVSQEKTEFQHKIDELKAIILQMQEQLIAAPSTEDFNNLDSRVHEVDQKSHTVHVNEAFDPNSMGLILAGATDDGAFTWGQLLPDEDAFLVDYPGGVHVTDDSDAAAFWDFEDDQFALVPIPAFDGDGNPVTRYYRISGSERSKIFRIDSALQDGSNKRWVYDLVEVEKTGTAYGGWTDKTDGLTPSGYNLAEDLNGATGVFGNGVNSSNLSGTFDIQQIPNDRLVRAWITSIDGEDPEWWFQAENGIDGACA